MEPATLRWIFSATQSCFWLITFHHSDMCLEHAGGLVLVHACPEIFLCRHPPNISFDGWPLSDLARIVCDAFITVNLSLLSLPPLLLS